MEVEIERLVGAMTLDEKSLPHRRRQHVVPPAGRAPGHPGAQGVRRPVGRAGRQPHRPALPVAPLRHGRRVDVEPRRSSASLGAVLAAEARSKGVHVLLGPTVCIVRTPLAGRTFESFSEDPLLTARIAVVLCARACRGAGSACCIKHFACNDQEHERMTISAEVDERALREIHLVAFEARRTGGRRLVRDDRLQQGQRRSTAASSRT